MSSSHQADTFIDQNFVVISITVMCVLTVIE